MQQSAMGAIFGNCATKGGVTLSSMNVVVPERRKYGGNVGARTARGRRIIITCMEPAQ